MSKGTEGGDEPKAGYSKLTAPEEKELRRIFEFMKKGMPSSMLGEIDKAFERLKHEGIPTELRETMDEAKNGTMTPAIAAKLWRLTSNLARKSAEASVADRRRSKWTGKANQKAGAHDAGPGEKEKEDGDKQKKGSDRPNFGEIKLDTNTILLSAFSSYFFYRLFVPGENSREITWQEFRNTFFDKGLVEKLVVSSDGTVRVHLHQEAVRSMYPESPAGRPNFYYYFSIGSVEAFERKVDEAQKELDIPSSERIPVQYSREGPWLYQAILGFGPTLLFVGALIYMSRRAGGGSSCLLYTSPSPRDRTRSRMPSSA